MTRKTRFMRKIDSCSKYALKCASVVKLSTGITSTSVSDSCCSNCAIKSSFLLTATAELVDDDDEDEDDEEDDVSASLAFLGLFEGLEAASSFCGMQRRLGTPVSRAIRREEARQGTSRGRFSARFIRTSKAFMAEVAAIREQERANTQQQ